MGSPWPDPPMVSRRCEKISLDALAPLLIPTPVNAGERPDTLDRHNGRSQGCTRAFLNAAERRVAGSTAASCQFDTCAAFPSRTLN